MTTAAINPKTVQRERFAVSLIFMIHGATFANWAARIPDVQHKLNINDQQLGLVLLGLSVGVVTALPLVGGLIGRFGSRQMTIMAGVLHSFSLVLLGLSFNFWTLWAALFFFGFVASAMDVSMNTQGVLVEQRLGKSVMSSFHAMFSIGLALGAFIGGQAIRLELSVLSHFLYVFGLFVIFVLSMWGLLVVKDADEQKRAAAFSLPPRGLWLIGAVAFFSTVGEGAMVDWSTKYMRDVVQATPAIAAYGLTVFSLAMTIGRFSGDWLIQKFSGVLVVRVGGILAALGLVLAVAVPTITMSLIGFALVGLGLAAVIPLAFSAAGRVPDVPTGVGIAGVATIGYAGFLAGPPIIGVLAEQATLRVSMGFVLVLMVAMTLLAGAVRKS